MRLPLLLLALLPLAACDAGADDDFAVEVLVTNASGAPLAGYDVSLVYSPVHAAGPESAPDAARGADGDVWMAPPAPTPWAVVTSVRYRLPEPVPSARIELFDLAGTLRLRQDVPGLAGEHFRTLHDDSTNAVPGGIYRVVGTFGTTEREAWTIHSDGYAEGWGWTRALGTTGADGRVRTDDRAAAPGLFDVPPIVVYNSGAGAQGEIRGAPSMVVEVSRRDGPVSVQAVTLRDGLNRVTVRVTPG